MPSLSLCIVSPMLSILLPASNSVAEVLGDDPSLQEILWNFSRFKDAKKRLTLSENPYFYAEFPTLSGADGRSFRLDPTEDFQSTNEFYVVSDRTKHLRTLINLASFNGFWCQKNAIIFKGLSILFFFPQVLMSLQMTSGGSGVKALSVHLSVTEARLVVSV